MTWIWHGHSTAGRVSPEGIERAAGAVKCWCFKCNAYKPERTHHCKTCKTCVLNTTALGILCGLQKHATFHSIPRVGWPYLWLWLLPASTAMYQSLQKPRSPCVPDPPWRQSWSYIFRRFFRGTAFNAPLLICSTDNPDRNRGNKSYSVRRSAATWFRVTPTSPTILTFGTTLTILGAPCGAGFCRFPPEGDGINFQKTVGFDDEGNPITGRCLNLTTLKAAPRPRTSGEMRGFGRGPVTFAQTYISSMQPARCFPTARGATLPPPVREAPRATPSGVIRLLVTLIFTSANYLRHFAENPTLARTSTQRCRGLRPAAAGGLRGRSSRAAPAPAGPAPAAGVQGKKMTFLWRL